MTALAIAGTPNIAPSDRLGLTLCFAIMAHAVLVLGVSFEPLLRPESHFERMEVILVQEKSPEPAADPQYLANAQLDGGGDADTAERPVTPMAAPLPELVPQIATAPAPPGPPPPILQALEVKEPVAQVQPPPDPVVVEPPTPEPVAAPHTEELVAETATPEVPLPAPAIPAPAQPEEKKKEISLDPVPAAEAAEPPLPSAAALIANSFQIASLNAEIDHKLAVKAKRPRRKFISASTKEYRYSAYMEAWRAKVERVGNLNYPDEARLNKLSGHLILDVALNADGSINELTIRKPSGFQVLDDAALRIVELAAPFAPFPDDFLGEVDILHITRTWQFLTSNQFSSK